MTPSDACYALARNAEGLRLEAYQDSGGRWSIGYGHAEGVSEGDSCTEEEAEHWLEQDMEWAANVVNRLALPATQGQFDALTDFTFNLGSGTFEGSTLLHLHRAGKFPEAAAQFGLWVHCHGEVLPGLVKRRAAEAHLYLS